MAAAFGVGAATAHRYVTEVIELLAELAPDLRQAMRTAQRKAYVIPAARWWPPTGCRAQATGSTTRANTAATA
ncbi:MULTISPECIES: transposase family protein [Actinomadura]|uniref:transposase family protein n=1 Tax=Actinomadura TaxID=1988 RepID=UPI001F0DE3E8|nr:MULTISPECIES: transposase family protein [Actinomadura]